MIRATSIPSLLYKGFMENGGRHETPRKSEYFSSSDEQQFETYEVGYLACLLMNSELTHCICRQFLRRRMYSTEGQGTVCGQLIIQHARSQPCMIGVFLRIPRFAI
jgi:hypothetical protein